MKKKELFCVDTPGVGDERVVGWGWVVGAEVQPVSQSVSSEEKIPPVPSTASRSGLQAAAKRLMLI